MDARDERLRQLLIQVLQKNLEKLERETAQERLLKLIPDLPGIRQSSHHDYLDALNQALMQVKQNIHKKFKLNNDSEPADVLRERFVRWVNSYLKYRIIDLYRAQNQPLSLDNPLGNDSRENFIDVVTNFGFTAPTLDSIDSLIELNQKQISQRKVLALELYIERDPENKLRNCYPANCPDCNCQTLAKNLFLTDAGSEVTAKEGSKRVTIAKAEKKVTVRSLAEKLGIKEQTAYTHWKRKCRPLFREIINDLENSAFAPACSQSIDLLEC